MYPVGWLGNSQINQLLPLVDGIKQYVRPNLVLHRYFCKNQWAGSSTGRKFWKWLRVYLMMQSVEDRLKKPVNEEDFARWNEEMSIRDNPDLHHNHPCCLMRRLERMRTDRILKYLGVRNSEHILDVGCGAGNMLGCIHTGSLYGIDLSSFLLELAAKRLGTRANLQKANAEAIPFDDNTFDKVFCSEVLEHTLRPQRVIDEMHRVLKTDGICAISFPNEAFTLYIKKLLGKVGIAHVLFGQHAAASACSGVDHWHLHVFSRAVFAGIIAGKFKITDWSAIPTTLLPIKYIARLRKIQHST